MKPPARKPLIPGTPMYTEYGVLFLIAVAILIRFLVVSYF